MTKMNKIQLEPRHAQIVWDIVQQFPVTFYAFGSRVTGNPRKYSDLDLFIKDEISNLQAFYIDDAFGESDLPFKVDVIRESYCDVSFVQSIEKHFVTVTKESLGIIL